MLKDSLERLRNAYDQVRNMERIDKISKEDADKMVKNQGEFSAYQIIHTPSMSKIIQTKLDITSDPQQQKLLRLAIQVASCIMSANFTRFFRLFKDCCSNGNYLIGCLLVEHL